MIAINNNDLNRKFCLLSVAVIEEERRMKEMAIHGVYLDRKQVAVD